VLTGVVLTVPGREPEIRLAETRVEMAHLDEEEIARYADGSEPYDKAGGYGIQGAAGWFVACLHGSFSNVMGLPLEEVRLMMAAAGLPRPRLDGAG
jgi:septum formation protein